MYAIRSYYGPRPNRALAGVAPSTATFSQLARREEIDALTDVIRTMVDHGSTVFDTAPSYGTGRASASR